MSDLRTAAAKMLGAVDALYLYESEHPGSIGGGFSERVARLYMVRDELRNEAASPAVPDGLDVERLARAHAMVNFGYAEVGTASRLYAEAIAAEYARLTPTEGA